MYIVNSFIAFLGGGKRPALTKGAFVYTLKSTLRQNVWFDRSSILEPGPVKTEVLGNADTWTRKYKTPTPDQKTLELQKSFNERFLPIFERTVQTAEEVAERVKGIIVSEKPNLRYHTNVKFAPDEVKAKLSDPTGNEIVEILNKKYLSKEWLVLPHKDRHDVQLVN